MSAWQRWVERPQGLLLRRIFFQFHLWLGIVAGLYIAVVSVSGGAIVARRHLEKRVHKTLVEARLQPRLSGEQIRQLARQAHPSDEVLSIVEPENIDRPFVVILESGNQRVMRLFDPYTGADLGDPRPATNRVFDWLTDFHDNLLSGLTGRIVNGFGALALVLMSVTGAVLWWPGIANWRRSTRILWPARFARFNWDLHSAVGFWSYLFVLLWGLSGIQLCFPGALDFLLSSQVRYWLTELHFGRFNAATEAVWTVVGLAPAILAATGVLMWWRRVLSKKIRRSRDQKTTASIV